MAGTLTISTLSDGTNSTSSTNCIQGSAKAWVNFNGSAVTIRASYNVSSIVRNGTGDFTVNFTNAFADTNYSVLGTSGDAAGQIITSPWISNGGGTTSSVRVACLVYNATYINAASISLAVFR